MLLFPFYSFQIGLVLETLSIKSTFCSSFLQFLFVWQFIREHKNISLTSTEIRVFCFLYEYVFNRFDVCCLSGMVSDDVVTVLWIDCNWRLFTPRSFFYVQFCGCCHPPNIIRSARASLKMRERECVIRPCIP